MSLARERVVCSSGNLIVQLGLATECSTGAGTKPIRGGSSQTPNNGSAIRLFAGWRRPSTVASKAAMCSRANSCCPGRSRNHAPRRSAACINELDAGSIQAPAPPFLMATGCAVACTIHLGGAARREEDRGERSNWTIYAPALMPHTISRPGSGRSRPGSWRKSQAARFHRGSTTMFHFYQNHWSKCRLQHYSPNTSRRI